jgi:ribosome-binding protein aMBF1 (putative translation factor)
MKTPMQQAIDKLIDLAHQMGTDDEVLDSFSAGERKSYLESASELHKFLEIEQNQLIEQWKKGWDEATSEAIKELRKYQ